MYNSTTLPPGLDSNVLDGGELVNVETKATVRNGQTSVSYTIVVKKGDIVEKVQQPGFNTSDQTSVVLPSPADITSSTTGNAEHCTTNPRRWRLGLMTCIDL